ncbi:MAG: SUMF1/EgtB/PvdO family nonheme iron enzyme [Deltaproteobacteria bacterium]|nr:SUMF1/EgtB/PvdO family nonheme iron enzyme [Deltaproteobacteria bacterium]
MNSSGSPSHEPGWDTAWNTHLHSSRSTWDGAAALGCNPNQTWTSPEGANENLPINCVNWFQAQAFCIWDGGFLPSEAEWNYAAAGGDEQRLYPWGAVAPGPNANLAVYGCYYNGAGSCSGVTNIAPVGFASAGVGRYGQVDLAGNVYEWNLDWYVTPYPTTTSCNDCAYAPLSATGRVVRGGSFRDAAQLQRTTSRNGVGPSVRSIGDLGVRCARSAQ